MGKPINVLISLHRGYGLGDAVQMSAVLRHVKKYRPEWRVDFKAERGHEKVGCGLVANTFVYGEPFPTDHYDAEVEILLYDTFANWYDRPNTRVASCLHERFGMGWDADCGRYCVRVSAEAEVKAQVLLWGRDGPPQWSNIVAVHYQGDSSQESKNLNNAQAWEVCRIIERAGYTPVVLDWRDRCPFNDYRRIVAPKSWGGDAEMVCAVISQCAAFIGIDSGPSKCASATDTPALVIWTGHHPAPFHDPAPNTTHLVPVGYHNLQPVCNSPGVIRWFEDHHTIRQYMHDPVNEVGGWLAGVLK